MISFICQYCHKQQMRRVLCAFKVKPDYVEFAVPEMKSLLHGCPVPLNTLLQEELVGRRWSYSHEINHQLFRNFPFVVLNVPDFETHRPFFEQFCKKAVTIHKTVLLLASGKNYMEMLANRDEQYLNRWCRSETDTFMCDFLGRNRTVGKDEQIARIDRILVEFGIKGKVNFKEPMMRYQLIEEHEEEHQQRKADFETLKNVFFGLQLSSNRMGNKFNSEYELKNRIYLGPTSTDNDLAFMMCNQALVGEGSLVYDPFVGTGGLLIPPASKGAMTFGSDLDIRVLNGYAVGRINKASPYYSSEKKFEVFKPKINLNFQQYGFPIPNIIRVDCTKMALHLPEFFDAIITDPPYGIRAMSRTVLTGHQISNLTDKSRESESTQQSQQQVYDDGQQRQIKKDRKRQKERYKFNKGRTQIIQREKIFEGLLTFALTYLRPQGRLVFLYPVYEEEVYTGAANLPPHPGFSLIDLSQNKISGGNSRILVTLQKL